MKIPNSGFQERAQKWASKKVVGGAVNGNLDIYYDAILCIPLDCTPLSAFWLGQKQNSNLAIPFAYTMQIVAMFDQQYGPKDAQNPKGEAWTKKLWQIQQPITKLPLARAGITIPARSDWQYECSRIMVPVEHPLLQGRRNAANQAAFPVDETFLGHVRSGGVWPYGEEDWNEGVRCFPFGYHAEGFTSDWNALAPGWLHANGFAGTAGAWDYARVGTGPGTGNASDYDHIGTAPGRLPHVNDNNPRLLDHTANTFVFQDGNGDDHTAIELQRNEVYQLENILRSCWPDRNRGYNNYGKFPFYQDGDLEPGFLWVCSVNTACTGIYTPWNPQAGTACQAIFPNPSGGAPLKFVPVKYMGVNQTVGGHNNVDFVAIGGNVTIAADYGGQPGTGNYSWHFFTAPMFSLPQSVSWELIETSKYATDKSMTKEADWERVLFSNTPEYPTPFSELLINQLQNETDAYSRAVRHLDISEWSRDPTPPTWTVQNDAAGHAMNRYVLSTPVKDSEIMHCLAFGKFKIRLTNSGGPLAVHAGYLPDMER